MGVSACGLLFRRAGERARANPEIGAAHLRWQDSKKVSQQEAIQGRAGGEVALKRTSKGRRSLQEGTAALSILPPGPADQANSVARKLRKLKTMKAIARYIVI